MSQKWRLIAETETSDRADKLIVQLLEETEEAPNLSRSQVQRLIDEGKILINGKLCKSKDKVAPGAVIEIEILAPTEISVEAENIPIKILFEDEHLVVVNKQPGLTVHPSETQKSGTLVNALLYHIKDLSGIGGKLRPGIVHRIDKDTSGALVITKHDEAHQKMAALFSKHDIERRYWALCYGAPSWDAPRRVETFLGRSPSDRKKMAVLEKDGRRAISIFSLIESYGLPQKHPFASLIEAKLETGRTHQVRVHLNHLGYSLFGDPLYGTPTPSQPKWKSLPNAVASVVSALPGQALHARVLGFVHPMTGAKLRFEAEPFAEFETLLQQLQAFKS